MKTVKLTEDSMKKLKELKLFLETKTYSETLEILYFELNKKIGRWTNNDQSKK